jgi:hypothetical protein
VAYVFRELGPLSGAGVTVDQMAAFARAAVGFHAAAPWRRLAANAFAIEAPDLGPDAGMLAFLEDEAEPGLVFLPSGGTQEEITRLGERGVWSVSLLPPARVPPPDLDLWARHHLPLAGRAYPVAARLGFGGLRERPDARLLAGFEGLLTVLASGDPPAGLWTQTVLTHLGPFRFTLRPVRAAFAAPLL